MNYEETLFKIISNRPFLSLNQLTKIFDSKYNRQAIDFLLETKTICDIELIGEDFSEWNKKAKVNKYRVTLKNKNHNYTFDFWDSIHNTEKRKSAKYDFYSVLACLGLYIPDSFDEFCADLGYEFKNETEYIKTKQIHLNCLDQNKNLRKLFTTEQLEKLSEIN